MRWFEKYNLKIASILISDYRISIFFESPSFQIFFKREKSSQAWCASIAEVAEQSELLDTMNALRKDLGSEHVFKLGHQYNGTSYFYQEINGQKVKAGTRTFINLPEQAVQDVIDSALEYTKGWL